MFFLVLFAKLTSESIGEFLTYAKIEKEKWKLPGTVFIGIIHNGKEEMHFIGESFDSKTHVPVSSLTKAMTANIVGVLVKKGLLRLDDPISKYLPDFKLGQNVILTIRDILSHRTGLYHFSGDSLLKLGFSFDEIYERFVHFKFKNKPGIDYGYQNLFAGLLEKIIEKVTGKKFDEVAKDLLFTPLGMNSAHYDELKKEIGFLSGCLRKDKNLPYLYLYQDEGVYTKIKPNFNMSEFRSSMGATMTCQDLMKWLKYSMAQNTTLVTKEFSNEMFKTQTSFTPKHDLQFTLKRLSGAIHYGLHWFYTMYGTHKIYFHMGSWDGMRSFIVFDPKENFGLVIWHNYGGNNVNLFPEELRARFLDIAYDYPFVNWVQEIETEKREQRKMFKESFDHEKYLPSPAWLLKDLCGTYRHKMYGEMKIKESGSTLYMYYRGHKVKMHHHNGNKFSFDPKEMGSYFDYSISQWVAFGKNKENKMVLQNSLMYETDDVLFVKE